MRGTDSCTGLDYKHRRSNCNHWTLLSFLKSWRFEWSIYCKTDICSLLGKLTREMLLFWWRRAAVRLAKMSEAREDLPGVLLWERFTAFSVNLSGQTVCDAGVYLCVFVFTQVQYGIFPDDFTFNLLLDSYIKDGDFKSRFFGESRHLGSVCIRIIMVRCVNAPQVHALWWKRWCFRSPSTLPPHRSFLSTLLAVTWQESRNLRWVKVQRWRPSSLTQHAKWSHLFSNPNEPGVRGAGAGSIAADLWTEARQQCGPERPAARERSPGCVFVFLTPQCVFVWAFCSYLPSSSPFPVQVKWRC